MPPIKIERIVSFSSEDPVHLAANLLKTDSNKRWKCKKPGEISATIVFQLDQPYIINSIDIGNEHSAYIEILVSRSTSPEEFQPFLIMTQLMTALEARQSQNACTVRMFKQEDFSDPERHEKWDRIKVVCTQPFNRHVQYGLSFINLHSIDVKNAEQNTGKAFTLGKFQIRPESPDNITKGSIFTIVKQTEPVSQEPLKGAAAIKAAGTAIGSQSISKTNSDLAVSSREKIKQILSSKQHEKRISITPIVTPDEEQDDVQNARNRNELFYNKNEDDVEDKKMDKLLALMEEERKKKQEETVVSTPKKHSKTDSAHSSNNRNSKNSTPKRDSAAPSPHSKIGEKRKHSSFSATSADGSKEKKHKSITIPRKPFNQLLDGVVFVISGIQNPDRSKIRSMALSMGAKYKADWDSTCTHLICAFINTPKFRQVKGQGKIVKKNWLEDCCLQRKRLPWRRYALDKADQGNESEEEIWEEKKNEINNEYNNKQIIIETNDDNDPETQEAGSDTEERIERLKKKQQEIQENKENEIYNAETDNEDEIVVQTKVDKITNNLLPDFYSPYKFYVYEVVFSVDTVEKLKRYITAYNGTLLEELNKDADFIITNKDNVQEFRKSYPKIACVSQDWIWKCHNKQTLDQIGTYLL